MVIYIAVLEWHIWIGNRKWWWWYDDDDDDDDDNDDVLWFNVHWKLARSQLGL